MTTVNISGTFSEKQKANNGLTEVADMLHKDHTLRVPVVGWVEHHQWTEKLTGNVLTVAIPVIESCLLADGSDPHGWGEAVMDMIDQRRKERGLSAAAEVPMHTGEIQGQIEFDYDGQPAAAPGSQLDQDGERQVPEASGEEIMAERAEAKAAGAPTATFSGGAE